jgi:hypothetical protein
MSIQASWDNCLFSSRKGRCFTHGLVFYEIQKETCRAGGLAFCATATMSNLQWLAFHFSIPEFEPKCRLREKTLSENTSADHPSCLGFNPDSCSSL